MEDVRKQKWSEENSIEIIQKLRNDLLKDFLDERYLKEYMATRYHVRELSNVKIEFIKKDIKELLRAPVDLNHYESLLKDLKDSDSVVLTEGNDRLFFEEADQVLKRSLYY